jgi:hypothetical protein
MKTYWMILPTLLLFWGCSDNALLYVHQEKSVPCLSLHIYPPNDSFKKELDSLYDFDAHCPYRLEVTYKNDIACNSAHKSLTTHTTSYLRMEIKQQMQLYYSYYIDLDKTVEPSHIGSGFKRLQETLANGL